MTFFHARITLLDSKVPCPNTSDARAVNRRQLAPDSLVLAAGFDEEDSFAGWWESIIVCIGDGERLVRWRDEPNEPAASRSKEYHPVITNH
jgi:hypothetical protein